MGDGPTVKNINRAATLSGGASVIKQDGDEPQLRRDPKAKAKTGTAKTTATTTKDGIDSKTAKVKTTTPDWQTRFEALERQVQAERDARIAMETKLKEERTNRAEAEKKAAKAAKEKGWLKKGLMDLLMLFLRMFFPIISLISLAVRVLRIAYKVLIKKEKMTSDDWKREGMLFLADLAGAAPLIGILGGGVGFLGGAAIGGVISAGIHGAMKVTSEDKDDMLGWEKDEPSGLRIGWEKARDFGKETYAAVTGKERPSETRAIQESGVDTRTVAPEDVTLSGDGKLLGTT